MSQDEETFWQQADWSRVALNSIGDAVIVSDALGRVAFMNPVAEALTGWSQAEAVGGPLPAVFRIVNEQTRQPVEDPVAKVLTSGLVLGLANHTLLRRRDGILQCSQDQVLAIVEDDGCGFDADAVISSRGPRGRLGLVGMRERVTLVGGTLTIESTPGRGTTIFARIPLSAAGEEASDGQ